MHSSNVSSLSLLIGTSGWYYDEWVGPFYDRKKGMFTSYTKVFNTAEVNSTFYNYPQQRTVEGWNRSSPPEFTFALKLPQLITHKKWLKLDEGVELDTGRFLNLLNPLYISGKLGPILIQLRPKFNYDEHMGALESYLEVLPEEYQWAVEFRHNSWLNDETYSLLKRHNVAYTIVDEPLLPPEVHVTADFSYIRWHGHGTNPWYNYEYSKNELESWLPKVEETKTQSRKVYGYFNNHYSANAVKNAVEMLTMLEMETPQQSAVLGKIESFRLRQSKPSGMPTLLSFSSNDDELSVGDHLMHFTNAPRLARAEKIDDNELVFTQVDDISVKAKVKHYNIDINREERVIKHDCDDWRKGIGQKRMCKHIAKVFLSLPEDTASKILGEIWSNMDSWVFEAE